MNKKILLSFSILLLAVLICHSSTPSQYSSLMINEVCSNNFSIGESNHDEYYDYIELYNSGENSISLKNYYLSDEKENPKK